MRALDDEAQLHTLGRLIARSDLVWRKNQYRPELIENIKRREFGAGISANVQAMARFAAESRLQRRLRFRLCYCSRQRR